MADSPQKFLSAFSANSAVKSLIFILLIADLLRFAYPLWDDGFKTHPDERYIYWIATSIEVPRESEAFFDLARNSLNPYRWTSQVSDKGVSVPPPSPRQFVYGHLPLYLLVFTARALNSIGQTFPLAIPFIGDLLNTPQRNEYNHFLFVGRALSAIFDLISIYAIYLIGRLLFDETIALCAAAFTALAVIHIQLSHFGAFDVHLTTFGLLTIFFAIRYVQENRKRDLILASVMMGFAVGTKAAGALLLIPLAMCVIIKGLKIKDWKLGGWRLEIGDWRLKIGDWKLGFSLISSISLFPFISFISFAITNPFSLIEFPTFISQISFQSDMARGEFVLPYTNQYVGTPTVWYVIEQQAKWLLGVPLTVAAYAGAGVLLCCWVVRWLGGSVVGWLGRSVNSDQLLAINNTQYAIRNTSHASRITPHASLIPLLWCLTFFLFTASLQVKYPRYMLPITPLLILYGAWAMVALARRWRVMWIAPVMTLITMALSALAFITMYTEPHPWVAMSQWMYRNVPSRSIILAEKWDDDLPLKVNADNATRSVEGFDLQVIDSFARPDSPTKIEASLRKLAASDYFAISSNRVYGVVARLDDRFPLSSKLYRALLDGRLGFEVANVTNRYPTLFGYRIVNDTFAPANLPTPALAAFTSRDLNLGFADESFALYDHPLAMMLKNVKRMKFEEMKTTLAP